ncbi:hypothetical protein CAAN3_04S01354 [[Candida] anglica]
MTRFWLRWWWACVALVVLLPAAQAALMESIPCGYIPERNLRLAKFILDVSVDESNKSLNFYVTSKVLNPEDPTSRDIVINDVNMTTNMFTTLHVQILFVGRTIIEENLRFCDLVSVKNTTDLYSSPRFSNSTDASGGENSIPGMGPHRVNETQINNRRQDNEDEYASESDNVFHLGSLSDIQSREDRQILPDQERSDKELSVQDISAQYLSTHLSPRDDLTNSIFNASNNEVHCPLYVNDTIVFYYKADISDTFVKLGSYTATFSLVSNDQPSQLMSCNKAYVTQIQNGRTRKAILYSVVVLAIVTALVNFFTVTYSSDQESSNPLLFTASTMCNEALLKQLDATVYRLIPYIQFITFTGALDLQYPGFYQPLVTKVRWSCLMGVRFFGRREESYTGFQESHLYGNFHGSGLSALSAYANDSVPIWPNFMVVLAIWCGLSILSLQILMVCKRPAEMLYSKILHRNKSKQRHTAGPPKHDFITWTSMFYVTVGDSIHSFVMLFSLPFLTITFNLFANASHLTRQRFTNSRIVAMATEIFKQGISYDSLAGSACFPTPGGKNTTNSLFADESAVGNSSTTSSNYYDKEPATKFYEDSSVEYLVPAGIILALWVAIVGFFIFYFLIRIKNFRPVKNPRVTRLYTSMKTIHFWGLIYNHLDPAKLSYVGVSWATVVARSVVIGVIQFQGCVQVICLVAIEIFDFAYLLVARPYYVKMTWWSSRWFLPFARCLVTILLIPFLRELDVSEAKRTYVAYSQFVIHVVVAAVFLGQLAYCFITTVMSIAEARRKNVQDGHDYNSLASRDSKVSSQQLFYATDEFEYHPIRHMKTPVSDRSRDEEEDDDGDSNIDDEKDLYFRGGVRPAVPRVTGDLFSDEEFPADVSALGMMSLDDSFDFGAPERACCRSPTKCSLAQQDELLLRLPSSESFHEQQQRSNMRRRLNDYTFREGDLIYKKYAEDQIDPEIKALWDARTGNEHKTNPMAQAMGGGGSSSSGATTVVDAHPQHIVRPSPAENRKPSMYEATWNKIQGLFGLHNTNRSNQITPSGTGFVVSRPRQIVVKQLVTPPSVEDSSLDERLDSGTVVSTPDKEKNDGYMR